ncbi:adenylate kinase [Enterovibrio sp. ZSDZ42]|uniref:Adenylate kinase n=1 Tax=Enterovibrio gelatinilyticus TaxID=2899819 RepID=A0ABT5R0C4_9GAMM|nr:adenylate kinase [Enterovibrio sp. ZSDZ42]MDD1793732.1 adenylate kinase [Enterovibrio sp. ZSDZ42]
MSKALSSATGIPLHPLDAIVYKKNGEFVERQIFDEAHESIISSDQWIIDGLGPLDSFNKRLEAADTLIYIDLPYPTSYWFVTKRLLKGLFVKPEGWPDGSSVLKGSLGSYKFLKLSPKFWNDDFTSRLDSLSSHKTVHIIRTASALNAFVAELKKPQAIHS